MAGKERLSEPSEGPSKHSEGPAEAGSRLVCASRDLADGGDGLRFDVVCKNETTPAFAIRHGGRAYA